MEPTPTWRARTTRVPRSAHHTRRMRTSGEKLGCGAGRPHGLPAGRRRLDRPASRHDVMAPAGAPIAKARGVGTDPVPQMSHLRDRRWRTSPSQYRGSPTSPRRGWPLDERRSGTCCTYFRRARLAPTPSGSTRRPRAAATTPQPNLPERPRRSSDTRAPKRGSRGTRSARVATTRTRNISLLGVLSRRHANRPRRLLVATGSPPMPATGEPRGPVAFGRESRWIPASCRTGEGGGPGTNRCRDRGRIADPGSAVHVPSPSVPGEGRARAPQPGSSRDLQLERDTGGTPFAGVGLGRAANETQFARWVGSVPAILPATAGGRPWPATG